MFFHPKRAKLNKEHAEVLWAIFKSFTVLKPDTFRFVEIGLPMCCLERVCG